jgi:hypothetical protein
MLAAGADPKPEALGAFETQALPVETAKPQTNLQFYMQFSESPIQVANAFHRPGASQKHKRQYPLFRYNLRNAQLGARGAVWTILS